LRGQLERGARARRGLEEQVDHGAAAQHRILLVGAAVLLDVGLGKIEKAGDLAGRQPLDSQNMPVRIEGGCGAGGRGDHQNATMAGFAPGASEACLSVSPYCPLRFGLPAPESSLSKAQTEGGLR